MFLKLETGSSPMKLETTFLKLETGSSPMKLETTFLKPKEP